MMGYHHAARRAGYKDRLDRPLAASVEDRQKILRERFVGPAKLNPPIPADRLQFARERYRGLEIVKKIGQHISTGIQKDTEALIESDMGKDVLLLSKTRKGSPEHAELVTRVNEDDRAAKHREQALNLKGLRTAWENIAGRLEKDYAHAKKEYEKAKEEAKQREERAKIEAQPTLSMPPGQPKGADGENAQTMGSVAATTVALKGERSLRLPAAESETRAGEKPSDDGKKKQLEVRGKPEEESDKPPREGPS